MSSQTIGSNRNGDCTVWDLQGRQVGSLKRIGQRWKLKAIGDGEQGEVVPDGGSLSGPHKMGFERLDVTEITTRLLGA
jgi:hypothetical protein